MFDTKKREYKFVEYADALSFADNLKGSTIRRSLPEFKGHANPGYSVWHRARTVADELDIIKLYRLFIAAIDAMDNKAEGKE